MTAPAPGLPQDVERAFDAIIASVKRLKAERDAALAAMRAATAGSGEASAVAAASAAHVAPPVSASFEAPLAAPSRPEWVRITGPANARAVVVGGVYRVVDWHNNLGGGPVVESATSGKWYCYDKNNNDPYMPTWEPCAAPGETAGTAAAMPGVPPAATGDTGEVEKARAKVVEAAIALRMADAAYVALHTSVKDDDDALQEARGRLDRLHAARLNKRFDLDAYTTELIAATGDHPSEARRGHESEGRGGPDAR